MSDWLISTTDYRADGIFSEFYQDDELFCRTLEHAYPNDGSYVPKLPRGATYTCVRGMHTLEHYNGGKPFETFEITNVPGRTGILFHPGNTNKDSDGCVCTGMTLISDKTWMIQRSQDAFSRFMSAMSGVDEFQLRVE